MKHSLIALAFATSFTASVVAQQKTTVATERASGTPQFAGQYHPAVGLKPGSSAHYKLGPDSTYNNNVLQNYYSMPGRDQEWIDEGQYVDRNSNSLEQINGFNFTYCNDGSIPGDVAVTWTFYEEVSVCGGPQNPSWPVSNCSYGIAGLPGGVNGNLACWVVVVDLTGIECDLATVAGSVQLFGYGQTWDNDISGPWLGEGGLGNEDSFVWFDTTDPNPATAFQGCFDFVGQSIHAGFAFETYGNPVETFSYSHINGQGADDRLVLTIDRSVQVGANVVAMVLDEAFGQPVASGYWFTRVRVDRKVPGIADAYELAEYSSAVYVSRSASGFHAFTVPAVVAGGLWYSQAATVSGGQVTAMSNALSHNIF